MSMDEFGTPHHDDFERLDKQAADQTAALTNKVPASQEPMIFIWKYGEDGCPTFVTIASSEDAAREAIVRHPEVSELLVSPEYLALITAPPSEVIKPEDGAVWVMNWRAEDRLEVEG